MPFPWTRAVALFAPLGLCVVYACRPDPAGGGSPQGAPTYEHDVAPILQEQCAICHQAKGTAPFPLLTYRDAVAHGAAIRDATAARTMPPFVLDDSGACQTYQDARWLDERDIATIAAWVVAGMPAGDGPEVPLVPPGVPHLPHADVTLDPNESYMPKTAAEDDYRCFVVDPHLMVDRFITGFEVHPGAPRMVRDVALFALDSADDEQRAMDLDALDGGPGYACFDDPPTSSRRLLGWRAGSGAVAFPPGTGLRMNAGRKTMLRVHYDRRNGTYYDRTTIDLQLASSVRSEAYVAPLVDELTVRRDMTVWGIWPQMQDLGSTLRVTVMSEADENCIARVNRWHSDWQGFAMYSTPLSLSAGDMLRITCVDASGETCNTYAYVTWGAPPRQ